MSIAVLGAGSWGTALAILLARNGHPVVLWARDGAQAAAMGDEGRNRRYLPDHPFPDGLRVTARMGDATAGARFALVAVPSYGFHDVCAGLADRAAPADGGAGLAGVFWATKGFDPASGRLLHDVAADILPSSMPTAVVSGPTFANEIAAGLPAAVSCASASTGFAETVAGLFRNDHFRVYASADIVGVQIGGAVKNVLAIAAGIADGLGFGANTRAALITRGLREIMRFGVAMGGQADSFMGLAGLGDLVLTCTDDQSRNRRFGLALASGMSMAEAETSVGQVVEGIGAARDVVRRARGIEVEMPIAEQVNKVLHEGVAPAAAVRALLARPPGTESE